MDRRGINGRYMKDKRDTEARETRGKEIERTRRWARDAYILPTLDRKPWGEGSSPSSTLEKASGCNILMHSTLDFKPFNRLNFNTTYTTDK